MLRTITSIVIDVGFSRSHAAVRQLYGTWHSAKFRISTTAPLSPSFARLVATSSRSPAYAPRRCPGAPQFAAWLRLSLQFNA